MNPFKAGEGQALDPNKMKLEEMLSYRGAEYRYFDRLRQNVRLSRTCLWGTALGCLAAAGAAVYSANRHVFGADNKGGELLTVRSRHSLDDELYGRAFQAMMYLAEPVAVAPESLDPARRDLAGLGVSAPEAVRQPVQKRAPHPKYL